MIGGRDISLISTLINLANPFNTSEKSPINNHSIPTLSQCLYICRSKKGVVVTSTEDTDSGRTFFTENQNTKKQNHEW
jgi:hypothetical protein